MEEQKKLVEALIRKAANVADADQTMKYTQAALNAAHAISVISNIKPAA